MTLVARHLVVKAGARSILGGVDLELAAGQTVAVVGPNGAGKSTLMRAISGETVVASGTIHINGRDLRAWSADEQALQRAVLPQTPTLAFPFRACDVVELGRYPHRGRATASEHRAAIAGAMEAADVSALAARDCRTLSGGELHRVHFARALAQVWAPLADGRTRHLLLDEPTAALDLAHQNLVMSRAAAFARQGGAVLAILHDLNLAAAFADRIVVVDDGRVAASGPPPDVLTPDLIRKVWRVDAKVQGGTGGEPLSIVVKHKECANVHAPLLRAAE
jgi:iron complex transport system ATP-binding protein